MPTMSSRAAVIPLLPLLLLLAAPAHGEVYVSPFLHGNFGDVELRRGGWGGYVGYLGDRLGVELDFDRHHHFYKDGELEFIPNPCGPGVMGPCIDDDTEAWLFNISPILRLPVPATSRWRPYVSGGFGIIYAWIHGAGEYDSDQLNPSLNLGAGTTFWVRDWFGVRADLRYFHAFVDEDALDGGYDSDYDFVRLSLGVTFAVPGL
jgi:hypothetical protein